MANAELLLLQPVENLGNEGDTITHEAGRFFADSVLHLKSHDFRAKAEGIPFGLSDLDDISAEIRARLREHGSRVPDDGKGDRPASGHGDGETQDR